MSDKEGKHFVYIKVLQNKIVYIYYTKEAKPTLY